jgi:D-Tyr-tRNAtyr deacylase
MNTSLLIRVATGATVAALATAGAAFATAGHSHSGPAGGGPGNGIAAAAAYLGVSAGTLRTDLRSGETLAQVANATTGKSAAGLVDALVAAAKTHLAADVAAGRLTQAQADEITSGLKDHIAAFVNGSLPLGRSHGPGDHGPGPELAAAATYLGISEDALRADLQAGKTLAQVADATSGKSASGLIDALVAADRTRIAALVNGTFPHP